MDGLVLLLIACLGIHRVFGEIVVNVTCTHNTWLIDSDTGQSPCYVFAELMGQCYNNNFTILPDGTALALNYYTGQGPVSLDIPCYCTTVQYQLLSACFACLDYPAETWDEYAAACHVVSPVVGYTDFTLPADAIIPAYAMLQTTEDFNLTLVDQIFWDHLPDTVPTATVPVVLSGTNVNDAIVYLILVPIVYVQFWSADKPRHEPKCWYKQQHKRGRRNFADRVIPFLTDRLI
ncbi:hypothetical protein CALVIDRAFT_569358 [Calocera viscosa TUFC12733]|uniref:Uncharacterized protein n=1 Tax=Calocera viscosa (strain TUFC12733) TaxID=1330018 RepID=A0A167G213_CALVF|nr:hypothetical protein CALVIDRAFT_569358 [Calocera viscosa TUFC12733]